MAKVVSSSDSSGKSRPALSPEAKENQMIALTFDLVEKRLRDGTASSQETTHFLKVLKTTCSNTHNIQSLESLWEWKFLKFSYQGIMAELQSGEENKLKTAKTEEIQGRKETKKMFEEAIRAMRTYSGQGDVDEDTNIF